ncbi:MAG: hypothetical protein ACD_60C00160G0004 [uncultured bacterium]|nr:MAG: hypothetical protein ACD_60C00160G0004 [uncultured bacterium]
MNTLNNAGLFLINTLFNLYLFVLTIRFILAYARANYFNPITQLIVKITQPLVAPVRRLIPNYRNIELATLIWIIIFEIVKILILIALTIRIFSTVEIIWLVSSDTLKLFLSTFFYAILFRALLSWFQPGYSPAGQLLEQVTAPIMHPLQRLIPPISGIDITPIPALIILQLLIILLP